MNIHLEDASHHLKEAREAMERARRHAGLNLTGTHPIIELGRDIGELEDTADDLAVFYGRSGTQKDGRNLFSQ